eukprot:6210102-Amphidinium_carterae.1
MDGQATRAYTVSGTILAGCALAVGLMSLYLLRLLDEIAALSLALQVVNVVDDIFVHSKGARGLAIFNMRAA